MSLPRPFYRRKLSAWAKIFEVLRLNERLLLKDYFWQRVTKRKKSCEGLKETQGKTQLSLSSPLSPKKWPFGRIVTNNKKLTEELNRLRDNPLRRGYNLSNIQNQFSKAIQHTQHELIFKDKPPNNETSRLLPIAPSPNQPSNAIISGD